MRRSTPSRGSDEDPLVKSRLPLAWRGVALELVAPCSVFSNTWIDRGTRLLLDSLPESEPGTFLDLGCGYGALGLPIAARFRGARGFLVDRDLLAVDYCARNAAAHGITNVEVRGGLGYRGVAPEWGALDWILLNFPARAGERVLERFIEDGLQLLAPGGELRAVVIAPLDAVLERLSETKPLGGRRVARTSQHSVFAFAASGAADSPPCHSGDSGDEMYLRDAIEWTPPGSSSALRLERPTDLADEPHRLRDSLPLLVEALPAAGPSVRRALAHRCGYGLVPALLLARDPDARVVAMDRDLLGTAFTCRNCASAGARLRVVESARLTAGGAGERFDLITSELLPPLGAAASLVELAEIRSALAAGGRAIVVGLSSQWRALAKLGGQRFTFKKVASRGPAAVYACDADDAAR
jgi:16S rRNA (guanine1207-N2)-methyltransferase